MLNSYGFDATFFIPVNWQRYLATKRIDALSYDDVQHIGKRFKIGSHGVNHKYLTQINDKELDDEIINSKKWWKEHGFDVNSFCYPRGYYSDKVKDKVKEAGYKWARTVKVGNLLPAKDPFETETTVHAGYDRKEYEGDWFEYARRKVKEAIKLNESGEEVIYHTWFHSEEVHRYQQWDKLGLLFKHLKDNLDV